MTTAIYQNQHYRVLTNDGTNVTLLSKTDEIVEALVEKVQLFKAIVKGGLKKRKRISARVLAKRNEIPVELKAYSNGIAEQVKLFRDSLK